MLPKQYRLKKKSAFNVTYKLKNSFHKCGITMFAGLKKDASCSVTRVGFVVSKKTHKNAVKRNRLKRLMRESYRLLLKSGNVGSSQQYMSLIFIGGANALDKKFNDVQNIIKALLEKLED